MFHLRKQKYGAYFSGDEAGSDPYPFASADAELFSVDVSATGFDWPETLSEHDTVFLELEVKASRVGNWVDPALLCSADDIGVCQYLEWRAHGKRHFNLSGLAGTAAGKKVQLRGIHLSWKPQQTNLIAMKNAPLEGSVLVIAPHPDDAEIAAFGLYADRDAWVVTVSAGEIGTLDFGGIFKEDVNGRRLFGRTRVGESISAPFVGNVAWDRAMNLGYFDGTLQALYRGETVRSSVADLDSHRYFRRLNHSSLVPKTEEKPSWSGLVRDLVHVIGLARPSIIVAPHPVLECHPDHKFVGAAVFEAVEACQLQHGRLLLYVVHPPGGGPHGSIHPVGQRDGVVSLPSLQTEEVLFETVYSHAVSDELQDRKVLALDVYRDIRAGSDELFPPESLRQAMYRAARSVYRHLVVPDSTFLRKSVRPNELFYTVSFSRAADFYRRFKRHVASSAGDS